MSGRCSVIADQRIAVLHYLGDLWVVMRALGRKLARARPGREAYLVSRRMNEVSCEIERASRIYPK